MENNLTKDIKGILSQIKKRFKIPVSITIAIRIEKDVFVVSDDAELNIVAKELNKIHKSK